MTTSRNRHGRDKHLLCPQPKGFLSLAKTNACSKVPCRVNPFWTWLKCTGSEQQKEEIDPIKRLGKAYSRTSIITMLLLCVCGTYSSIHCSSDTRTLLTLPLYTYRPDCFNHREADAVIVTFFYMFSLKGMPSSLQAFKLQSDLVDMAYSGSLWCTDTVALPGERPCVASSRHPQRNVVLGQFLFSWICSPLKKHLSLRAHERLPRKLRLMPRQGKPTSNILGAKGHANVLKGTFSTDCKSSCINKWP